MKQKVMTLMFVIVIVGLLSAVVWGSQTKKSQRSVTDNLMETVSAVTPTAQGLIFFYGNTCPHCADVEAWMKENQIEAKVELVKKEVYDNQANAMELTRAAQTCNLDTDSIGVPFLYTPDHLCLIGTPDITQYLTDLVERRTE